jgi:hypothetical protein
MIDVRDNIRKRGAYWRVLRSIRGLLRNKVAIEIYLNHAALVSECANHVVCHVARHVGDRACGRVRRNQGRLACLERVPECLVRNMRNIDHHAQTVHLAHDLFALLSKPVMVLHLRVRHIAG